jgi:hypothetical protein
MDFSSANDGSGLTSEAKLQNEIAGDDVLLHFVRAGTEEIFHSEVFKQGVTFEWVKNKICEKIESQYEDTSLYIGEKRIPEPFCLIDMGVKSDTHVLVTLVEGALTGEALKQKMLDEMGEDDGEDAGIGKFDDSSDY